jgi:hypothetical protein
MSEVNCPAGWQKSIFSSAQKVKSTFNEKTDTPRRFKGGLVPGKTDFLTWANLPVMPYSASPSSLYDLPKLQREMQKNDCFVQAAVEKQAAAGIKYPPTFYAGLALGAFAILYSLGTRRG